MARLLRVSLLGANLKRFELFISGHALLLPSYINDQSQFLCVQVTLSITEKQHFCTEYTMFKNIFFVITSCT